MGEEKKPRELIAEALEQAKAVYEQAKQRGDSDAMAGLMLIRENLQVLREKLADIREMQSEADEKLKSLENALTLEGKLIRHTGVYWQKGDSAPYCPTCWEIDHKAVHLNPTALMGGRLVKCMRCEYSINLDNVSQPKTWPE